jgi:cobaltochelatase CobN
MKPDAIEDQLWADLHEVYVKDQLNLGIKEWFRRENPAALQEMTAVMLETVRKGYWKASAEQVAEIAQLHVELIKDTKPGCSGFVCDNQKLQGFISEKLGREDQQSYQAAIAQVRVGEGQPNAVVLEKEKMDQRPALSPVRNLFRSGRVVVVSTIVVLLILVAIFVWWRRRES